MATAITIVVSSILGLAFLVYVSFLAARYFFVPSFPDEIHFATTTDGWRISLTRYRPAGPADSKRSRPVVLVHGLAANRRNFDLTEDRSLARWLAARGHDTWIVELRGRGLSTRPRLFSGLKYEWSFDEYVDKDLPAALAAVRAATGSPELHLVGFSIGALACYAHLTDGDNAKGIRSLTSLAGAAYFKRMAKGVSGRLVRNLRWMRHRWIMRVLAPISGYWHLSPLQIIHNPENTTGPIQRRAMVNMIANFARNELLQYSDWILADAFRSIDQRRDYRAELEKLTVPTLFVAGARDILATADAVKDTMERLGATDKKFVICSRAQGYAVNYGHFDLTIGNRAPDEIFPLISGWINAHEGVAAVEAPEVSSEAPASVS